MKLSKREYIALELLKEMVKVDYNDVANRAYLLADEFLAISNQSVTEDKVVKNSRNIESAIDSIFLLDISVLETSTETKAALNNIDVKTIEDLVMLKPFNLTKPYPYFSPNSRNELEDNLKKKGLKVGMSRHEICDYTSDKYVRITEDSEGNPMFRPIL